MVGPLPWEVLPVAPVVATTEVEETSMAPPLGGVVGSSGNNHHRS
jgi:hypothetical protein